VVIPLWRIAQAFPGQAQIISKATVVVLMAGMFFIKHYAYIFLGMLGRNATLTGRTAWWDGVEDAIMRQPLGGYGYDVFWASLQGEALEVRIRCGWLAVAADNGFLDLGLGLGFLGLVGFACFFLWSFRLAVRRALSESGSLAVWPVTYFCFFLVHNMSESTLLTRGNLPFLLFGAIATSLALARHDRSIALVIDAPDIRVPVSALS
jgi:exopolysaccharide production protein ExoQ